MAPLPSIAASLIALALLLGEHSLQRSTALRRVAHDIQGMARLCIAALLAQSIVVFGMSQAFTAWNPALLMVPATLAVALILFLLLARRHGQQESRRALVWPMICSSLALLAGIPLSLSATPHTWLLLSCALALILAIGLPAQAALARQLDTTGVPSGISGLPAHLLTSAILALAMTGMLKTW